MCPIRLSQCLHSGLHFIYQDYCLGKSFKAPLMNHPRLCLKTNRHRLTKVVICCHQPFIQLGDTVNDTRVDPRCVLPLLMACNGDNVTYYNVTYWNSIITLLNCPKYLQQTFHHSPLRVRYEGVFFLLDQSVISFLPSQEGYNDSLMQKRHNSIVNAKEWCLFCTKPLIYYTTNIIWSIPLHIYKNMYNQYMI